MKKILSLIIVMSMLVTVFASSFAVNAAGYATGQQIVEAAMQYIGKVPYVWGGTKIDGDNPGADCSGFICRLYEKFGFNMWANRTKLRNCGTNLGTDMSVAQLGDIIWYEGHVAIYAGKDASGNHMIVHETGGKYQNVVYTKHKIVSAELKGIIRIPGVVNDGSTAEIKKAWFSPAVDSTYVAKQKLADTNAVVVNQVNKLSGVKVTQMGIYVYDASGNLIKRHIENISNVGNSTTKYHSWYDMNSEVGITLTSGTTYQYKFFGVFDGQEIVGDMYSFKTTGPTPTPAPAPQPEPEKERCEALFIISMVGSDEYYIEMDVGSAIGELPEPIIPDGFKFEGYYTMREGGELVTPETICYGDTTYYARYSSLGNGYVADDTPHGIVIDYGSGEEETYQVYFWSLGSYLKSKEVKNGEKYGSMPKAYDVDGMEFVGYYTKENGGKKITEDTVVDLSDNLNLYARYAEIEEEKEPEDKKHSYDRETVNSDDYSEIILSIGSPYLFHNGHRKNIDDNGTKPFIHKSRTLLPVRAVVEAMGGTVEWNGKSKVVSLKLNGYTLFLKIDDAMAWDSDGEYYELDAAPMISNGRTMLPIRFIVEKFGGIVEWDNSTQSVIISYR